MNKKELDNKSQEKEYNKLLIMKKRCEERKYILDEKNKKRNIKNKYKKERLESKLKLKEEKEQIRHKYGSLNFMNFFTKYSFIGLVLILIGIILSLISDEFVWEIISNLSSTIGVALLVGSIFDFSKNSEAFVGFVSKILKDIIVSKNFLSSLAEKDKKEALKIILQPSYKQIEQYSNINEYFKKKIDDSMEMFETNFKTCLTLIVEAKKDRKGNVHCETLLSYIVYKVGDKFESIKVHYEKDGSKTKEIKIIYEDGEMTMNEEAIQSETTKNSYIFKIPESLNNYDKLTIKRKVEEPGYDHWTNFIWKSITPYEGIKCYLKCFDGLTIKEYIMFDNEDYYQIESSDDKTTLNIISTRWLERETGFFVTISDTSFENNKDK